MKYSEELVEFVKRWEGLKLTASPDPLVPGIWDIGHGHVLRDATNVAPTITREQADKLLREDLDAFSAGVDEACTVTLAQHEHDALCSLSFNVGMKAVEKSTLLHRLNRGDFDVGMEFLRWNRAGGRIVQGLVKRRQAERDIFEKADYSGAP